MEGDGEVGPCPVLPQAPPGLEFRAAPYPRASKAWPARGRWVLAQFTGGEGGDAGATPALAGVLQSDASPAVRGWAARALGQIGTEEALRAVANAALSDPDQRVRSLSAELAEQKARAMQEAAAQAEKLVAEAERRAEQIRREAKKAAERARKEGYARADQVEREAAGNPIAEITAREGAKRIRRETDKRVDQMLAEANRRADQAVAEARKRGAEGQQARRDDAPIWQM